MIRHCHAGVLAGLASLTLGACAPSSRWPRLTEGARYDVYNPTPCRADVYTATDDNVTLRQIGTVPSGGRVVVTVPPGSQGTRVAAMALYRDGTNCEVGSRIQIKQVRP